jgi:nucleoside-diphosphate kinase
MMIQPTLDEICLILVKPDGVVRRQAGVEVIKIVLALPGVRPICFKHVESVPVGIARLHYAAHIGKPFFPRLLESITASPGVLVLIVDGPTVIERVRALFGPTFVEQAAHTHYVCVRGIHGTAHGINLCHASSSVDAGKIECAIWTAAANLVHDESIARKAISEYLEQFDGRFPLNSEMVHNTCAKLDKNIAALKRMLTQESDATEDVINTLVQIILWASSK